MTAARTRVLAVLSLMVLLAGILVLASREDGGDGRAGVDASRGSTSTSRRGTTSDAPTSTAAPPSTAAPTSSASTTATSAANAGNGEVPATTTAPAPPPPLAPGAPRLAKVADLSFPVAGTARGSDVYLAERAGRIVLLRGGTGTPQTVLEVEVDQTGEGGLLGLAMSRDGQRMYLSYTVSGSPLVSVIQEATVRSDGTIGDRRDLLRVDQPFSNHNGGHVAIGPDGHLYIGLGDGGSANDPGNRAQDLGTLLGKILRIDPTRPAEGRAYGIPPGNPFGNEIWAYGLRNPWRFSFDRATGDLWIADVGQGSREEVNRVGSGHAGVDYGWRCFEGTLRVHGCDPGRDYVGPTFEYARDRGGCSVTGGYRYRGSRVALGGQYLYGDYCDGRLRALELDAAGRVVADRTTGMVVDSVLSFVEDNAGELYVLAPDGAYRIVAA